MTLAARLRDAEVDALRDELTETRQEWDAASERWHDDMAHVEAERSRYRIALECARNELDRGHLANAEGILRAALDGDTP